MILIRNICNALNLEEGWQHEHFWEQMHDSGSYDKSLMINCDCISQRVPHK